MHQELSLADLNAASIKLFRLLNKQMLGERIKPTTVGASYMPTEYADALNKHSPKKPKVFLGNPLEFYFNHTPRTEVTPETVDVVHFDVNALSVRNPIGIESLRFPSVCVFGWNDIQLPFLKKLEHAGHPSVCYWDVLGDKFSKLKPWSNLYNIFIDEDGVHRAELIIQSAG